ncbi:VOC family protein [Salinifilum aidingensis]
MDQRTHVITLATDDLHAARSFYVDGLDWQPALDVPGEIIFFQTAPGMLLGLFDTEQFHGDIGSATPGTGATGISLAHNVDSTEEVDATVRAAVEAGGTLVKTPQRANFGGYHGHVTDPNGVLWEICHNPWLRFAPDGTAEFLAE